MSGFGNPVTSIWGNTNIGNKSASSSYERADNGDNGYPSDETLAARKKAEAAAEAAKKKEITDFKGNWTYGGKRRRTRKSRRSRRSRRSRKSRKSRRR